MNLFIFIASAAYFRFLRQR